MKITKIKHIIADEPIQFYDVIDAKPFHNFLVKVGKSNIISHNCSFEDEVSFQPTQDIEKQKKKAKELISSIDARMSSRFLHGEKLPTLHILASSKRTDQSFLETYIDMKKKNESKTTLVIDEAQWVIRTDKDSPKKFAVAVGNKFLDSEVLPLTATEDDYQLYIDKGYRILMVPMGYHEQFLDDINIALTDIAGISTSSSSNYISGVRWTQCRNDKLENPFIREVLEIGNDPADKAQYYDYFDLTKVPKEMKSRPLFIHLDMSITGDKTGIAGVWIRGKMPGAGEEGSSKELFYQLAFSVSIKAPKGRQVSFEKNRQLIYWLRQQGFNIKGISYDTFNSVDLGQALQNKGFNCSVISVDRLTSAGPDTKTKVCIPYQTFRNAIYEGRFMAYPTKLLTAEIVGLVRDGNGKVDHSPAGINCLTGDTKLSLTDGRELPIKDIIAEYRQGKVNYVYSYNETSKHIEPKKITNGWCSGIADRLIKITLDNGEVIEATPEHKFLLRSGEYVCAKDLIVNDSLMPLYRKYPREGGLKNYRMYYDPMFNQWHYEHRQFAEKVYDKKYLVHHIDCNPHNNNPDNLLWMSKSAHTKIHAEMQTGAQSEEAKKRRKESLTNWWKDNKTSEKGIAKIRHHYKGLSDTEIIAKQNAKKAAEESTRILRTKALKELFGVDYNTLNTHDKRSYMSKYNNFKRGFDTSKDYAKEKQKHNKELSEFFNINFEELSETERRSLSSKYAHIKDPSYQKRVSAAVSENHKKGKYTKAKLALAECNKKSHQQRLERYYKSEKYKEILAMNTLYGIDYEKLAYNEKISYIHRYHNSINKKIKNHKVAKIEVIDCNIPVYDITVEDNHNFALSAGIIVHNSKDCADAVCLDGQTKIYTLSGKHQTIQELYDNKQISEWVLGYNTITNVIEPVKIADIVNNGYKENVVKITLDNGESVICTDDHRLLARDGSYVKAKDSLNVSLMPFNYTSKIMYKDRDYPYIYLPQADKTNKGVYLHKLVAESVKSNDKLLAKSRCKDNDWVVIHHKDCNRFNNLPENLEYLTNIEHSMKHTSLNSSQKKKNQLRAFNKERLNSGTHPFLLMSKDQHSKNGHNAMLKLNKSEKHRKAISDANKKRLLKGTHTFQLNKGKAWSEAARKKRDATCLKKYGGTGFKSDIIQQKCREACLSKNGYDNPFHSLDRQHYFKIKKIKNSWNKICEYFNLNVTEPITLLEFKIYAYQLHINCSTNTSDILEANIPVDSSSYSDIEYKKIRNDAECINIVLKSLGKTLFTYQEFVSEFEKQKQLNISQFRYRFKECPAYDEIVRLGYKLYNHRVVKIEKVPGRNVFDLKLDKIHNFALTAGIFVHNCGSVYDASLHSEEYEYNYGDSLEQLLTVNSDSNYDDPKQLSLNLENELIAMYGQRAIKGNEKPQRVHPSDANKPTDNFTLYNDIIIL